MSVMTRLRGVFSASGASRGPGARRASSIAEVKRSALDGAPIDEDYAETGTQDLGRRSKQELLAELQKNYQEVLGLVRKVDQHLDAQHERGERLREIAERVPPAIETLPAIQEQTTRLSEAIDRLNETTARHAARSESASQAQSQSLAHVKTILEQSQAASRRLTVSVEAFRESVDGVTAATRSVGEAIERVEERAAAREAQLTALIERGGRTMTLMTGFCGLAFAVTVIVAMIALAV